MFKSHQVQNELEAYLLGFLYADGYITGKYHGRYYLLGIGLKAEDKDFLQWICDEFNKAFNKSIKIKYQEKTNSYKWEIGNIILVSNLISLGIIPHKTYENNSFVFDNVPDNLKRHFIRGYFDGDGSVTLHQCKNLHHRPQLTGNFVSLNGDLLKKIQLFLEENQINCTMRIEKDKYYRLQFAGNSVAEKLRNLFYQDSNFYLTRKKDVFYKTSPIPQLHQYRNISIHKQKNGIKYKAEIYFRGERYYLGLFTTIYDALQAYNNKAKEFNLPEQEYKGEQL